MPPAPPPSPEQCPVDPSTRQKWLDAAAKNRQPPPSPPFTASPTTSRQPTELTILNAPAQSTHDPLKLLHQHGLTKYSLDALRWVPDFSKAQRVVSPSAASTAPTPTRKVSPTPRAPSTPPNPQNAPLPTDREVSTIPRAQTPKNQNLNSAERAALPTPSTRPANNESESGADTETGNWIYPSQAQFFTAMTRKGHQPNAADMQTIVPIHNAVNERAWSQIKAWEFKAAPEDGKVCGGPKLVSFSGDSSRLSPRARWKGLLGYERPFDRHDWVVERCSGERVEYLIDFYQGRDSAGGGIGGGLSFYLDVRPKINSWAGVRMRTLAAVGLG